MAATPSRNEAPATYEDANLLLRLYELRREDKMRQARDWFMKSFHANTAEDFLKLCPPGSEENAYFRMVVSYWDMAASFVTNGILHRDLFIQNSRELLFVWIRISGYLPSWRERMKNPTTARNIETLAGVMIEREKQQGSYESFRNMVLGS